MIVDIFFLILGYILLAVVSLFSLLSYAIPTEATSAIAQAFSYLAYLQAFFPIDTLVAVVTSFLAFLLVWYSWRIILFVYSMLPVVGKSSRNG